MNLYKVTLERLKGKSKTIYGYPSSLFSASDSVLETLEHHKGIFKASEGYRVSVGRARLSDVTGNPNDTAFLSVEENTMPETVKRDLAAFDEGVRASEKLIAQDRATNALQRAIDYLGAVKVAPGRYAYRSDDVKSWCIATAAMLENLSEAKQGRGPRPNLKPFCDAIMPPWWSPEARFAWRIAGNGPNVTKADRADRFGSERAAKAEAHFIGGAAVERITADLETGEEIPA